MTDYEIDLRDAEKVLKDAEQALVDAQEWAVGCKVRRDIYKNLVEQEKAKV